MTGGFEMSIATGSSDLSWNLVFLFFITTIIAIRPSAALVSDVVNERAGASQPLVIDFPDGFTGDDLLMGLRVHDGEGEQSLGWLTEQCRVLSSEAQVSCPDDAIHRDCRSALQALLRAAPGCRYQY